MFDSSFPTILYEDSTVAITQDQVQVKNYSYPLPFTKKVNFSSILSLDLNNMQESLRWGYNKDKSIWFALDDNRFVRKKYISLTLHDQKCKVGFTPQKPQKVHSIIQTKLKSRKAKQNMPPKMKQQTKQTYDQAMQKLGKLSQKISQKDKQLDVAEKKPLQVRKLQKNN